MTSSTDTLTADNTLCFIYPSPKPIRVATELPETFAKIGAAGDPAPAN